MVSPQALIPIRKLNKIVKNIPLPSFVTLDALSKFAKILVYLLFFLNIRSWPLSWHFRVFRDVIITRLRYYCLRSRMLFMSRKAAVNLEDDWLDSISPIGTNPFKFTVAYRSWAGIDDCDFNLHLSNSSYGKVCDYARMRAALSMFPMFFRAGGWMPLAATHFYFIREIPMLHTYEIRTRIAAWDQKWVYMVSKLVRKVDKKKKHHSSSRLSTNELPIVSRMGALGTGESAASTSAVTSPASKTPVITINGIGGHSTDTEISLNAVAAQLAGAEEPDESVLHTIHVAQFCFKIGRITIPPNLVLATNGFTGFQGHSVKNPHPQWLESKKVMSKPMGGNPKKMRDLMIGGWRNIPEWERWWDCTLGDLEEQRVKNLSIIDALRKGLEHARTL